MRRIGVGYRKPLANWIESCPPEIGCLEITAEHFFDDQEQLLSLRNRYPILVHALGLSLGTPGKLDREYLARFVHVCEQADPLWVSEHIAFTRTEQVDLGHLNPVPYTMNTLGYFVDHALEVSEACNRPLLLENITSHLQVPGELTETDFMNRLCEQAGCYLLLDVTNLFVNSRNHKYDALQWLRELEPGFVRQLHIVGYSHQGDVWFDTHAEDIQQELYQLTRQVIDFTGVDSIIIERDNNFPPVEQLRQELRELEACYVAN